MQVLVKDMDRDYDGKCTTFCASLDPPRVCAGQWDDDTALVQYHRRVLAANNLTLTGVYLDGAEGTRERSVNAPLT